MNEKKRKNIHEIISSITEKQSIKFFLIISYEFDDKQFFNLFKVDESEKIATIQQIKPIAIFDAKNTTSCMPYIKWIECHTQNKNYSCHHSKAYCIITENNEIYLILGSANFTEQGLFQNREVLEYFHWNEKQTKHITLLEEWIKFLKLYSFYQSDTVQKSKFNLFCEELQNSYKKINSKKHTSSQNREYFLLYSGYNKEKGLEKVKEICQSINLKPTTLYVVSPFFDTNSEKNICENFIETFPKLNQIHVCTDKKNYLTILSTHFKAIDNQTFYSILPEIDKNEYKHIEKINESTIKQDTIIRHLHAKILLLSDDKKGIYYIGSANFTQNAWLGKNNELGIVKIINNPQKLWEEIQINLFAKPTNKNEITFSSFLKNIDDIDEEKRNFFPDFIDYIELKVKKEITSESQWITDKDIINFIIHIDKNKKAESETINTYTVTWKDKIIKFKKENYLISEDIKSNKWRDLLLSDSGVLCFEKNNDKYYIPFYYDMQLLVQPELIIKKSSNDILLSYSGYHKKQSDADEDIDIAFKENYKEYNQSEELKEIRKLNPIIEMQEYLKSFGIAENSIYQTINNKKVDETTIKKELEKLAELARVINQEYQLEKKNREATLFKLGEIYYFIKQKFTPYSKEILNNIESLIKQIQSNNKIEANYIQFILENNIRK